MIIIEFVMYFYETEIITTIIAIWSDISLWSGESVWHGTRIDRQLAEMQDPLLLARQRRDEQSMGFF
ncbi:hypothetical protein [Prevotella sp. P6B1]|uniref:hypothetical protein n=1 Tax=Prevotella sp. P6B1 TaxID=1410613 RepID=UPI0012DF9D8A|nr:hypothetical protein [Prevotella sp. P6B1]